MAPGKPLMILRGEIKTPPMSRAARVEAGYFLRQLQEGVSFGLPYSRPMPIIGKRCDELRIKDEATNWRIIYRIDSDAIIVVEVFAKKTGKTPMEVIETCKRRLASYDS